MGVAVESGGKGGKKSVNADLNLVPYIDLLTCMVAFLLITAVWTQLARLPISQKGTGGETDVISDAQKIAVIVHDDGFNVIVGDKQKPLPRKAGQLDYATLAAELKTI